MGSDSLISKFKPHQDATKIHVQSRMEKLRIEVIQALKLGSDHAPHPKCHKFLRF